MLIAPSLHTVAVQDRLGSSLGAVEEGLPGVQLHNGQREGRIHSTCCCDGWVLAQLQLLCTPAVSLLCKQLFIGGTTQASSAHS